MSRKTELQKQVEEATAVDKGGRPPIELSEEQVIEIRALAQFLSKEMIADYLGISRPTFDAILERQPEVSLQYKKGKAGAVLGVSKSLINKAIAGNMVAAIFYLKTQAGWKETSVIDHQSTDGTMSPDKGYDYSKLTDDELRIYAALESKVTSNTSGAGET